MPTPSTDQVKAAYKAGAHPYTPKGRYLYQDDLDADFEDWLRGVRSEAKGPCTCEPYWPGSDGPSEDCAQHGREYAYWVEGVSMVAAQRDAAEEKLRLIGLGHFPEDTSDDPRKNRPRCSTDGEGWPCTTKKILDGVQA